MTTLLASAGPSAVFALGFYWHLPVLIVVISLVYSGTRHEQWGYILPDAIRWAVRMSGFLLLIAFILYVLEKLV